MFYDLFVSFPSANIPTHIPSSSSNQPALPKQSKKSRKANASAAGASGGGGASAANDERDKEAKRLLERERERQGCWFGVASDDREKLQGAVRMERHFGYTVLSFVQTAYTRIEASSHHNPFYSTTPYASASRSITNPCFPVQLPFPTLDPRYSGSDGGEGRGRPVVQLSRMHLVLDDGSCGSAGTGFLSQNTPLLGQYDILSVTPSTLSSFQLACLTLASPGPNQISLITLPLTQTPRGLPYHLKRKPILAALRSGVVFEICYAPLLPSFGLSGLSPGEEAVNRRNVLSGARDLVRITKGKGIVLSSGGSGWGAVRGVQDVINLGTLMGLTPDQAHAAVCLTPKKVVLRAQARKTYRGVISLPKIITEEEPTEDEAQKPTKNGMDLDG